MKIVITYGTFDLMHKGHIRLLERAKKLGDYLIVGVTSNVFDAERGKINVCQDVVERVEAVRSTNLADKIIIEEYEGQKIDDILKYGVNIFAIGSDREGKFDYLNEYCKVVYLDRTKGISSSDLRSKDMEIKIGIMGYNTLSLKFNDEAKFVNGVSISTILVNDSEECDKARKYFDCVTASQKKFFENCDAVYIVTHPDNHYLDCKKALLANKHVICESPIANCSSELDELYKIASEKGLVLMDSIKTAYTIGYQRLILLLKSGIIGDIVSIDSTCTSLKEYDYSNSDELQKKWSSYDSWGPTALLPCLQLFGTKYKDIRITSKIVNDFINFDIFDNLNIAFDSGIVNVKIGEGIKSEGELIVSGTKGYAYVPAPWWKSGYFEIRYEDMRNNKKYYYKVEGEGIRYEIFSFISYVKHRTNNHYISKDISKFFVTIKNKIKNKNYIKI